MSLSKDDRNQLLEIARQSIDLGLHAATWANKPDRELRDALADERASFVTLRIGTQLRGCCGNLYPTRPVGEDVWRNAWASAFADPRFSPLEADEWPDVHIHLSVLSPLEPLNIESEEQLLEVLRPKIDGLVLERDHSRATFLPDVWEQVPDKEEFVRHLKQKAGWPANTWSPQIKVWRYTTESFGEHDENAEPSMFNSRRA